MSLLIGIHIQEVLTNAPEITAVVKERIYPLVIPAGVPQYPYILFINGGITDTGTKDGTAEDSVVVGVAVASKSYGEAVRTANRIRYLFVGKSAKYEDLEVRDCELLGSNEEYLLDIDVYTVTLQFNFKTLDY